MERRFRIACLVLATFAAVPIPGCDDGGGSTDAADVADDDATADDGMTEEDAVGEDIVADDDGMTVEDGGGDGGDVASATIGPAGGSLATADGRCAVEVPPGAVESDTTFTIEFVEGPPAGAIGVACRFGPEGATFTEPVAVTIRYDGAALGTATEEDLAVATWDPDGSEWAPDNTSYVDVDADLVTAHTSHFSIKSLADLEAWASAHGVTTFERVTTLYLDAASGLDLNSGTSPGAALQSVFEATQRLMADDPYVVGTAAYLYGETSEVRLADGTYEPSVARPEGDTLAGGVRRVLRYVGGGPATVYAGDLSFGSCALEDMSVDGLLTVQGHAAGRRLHLTQVLTDLAYGEASLADSTIEGGGASGVCVAANVGTRDEYDAEFSLTGSTVRDCAVGIDVGRSSMTTMSGSVFGTVTISNCFFEGNGIGLRRDSHDDAELTVDHTSFRANGTGVDAQGGTFDDGNTFSCNTEVDFRNSGDGTTSARNSLWDNVPPRSVTDGGNDVEGDVNFTGAALTAERCADETIVPTVTAPESVTITDLFDEPHILISGDVSGSGPGVFIHDLATYAAIFRLFDTFWDASYWQAAAVQTTDAPCVVLAGSGGLSFTQYVGSGFGMTVALGSGNRTDICVLPDPLGGSDERFLAVNNAGNTVNRYNYVSGTGGFSSDSAFSAFATPGASGNKVSVAADPSGDRIVFVTDGSPGQLWFFDSTVGGAATLVGDAGDSPRRIRCTDAPSGGQYCSTSSFDSDELRGVLWPDPAAAPTIASTVTVGDGPVGIDLRADAAGFMVLSTGSNDNTAQVDYFTTSGIYASTTVLTLPTCNGPAHAAFVGDPPTAVVVTCHLDGTFVVVPIP